VKNIADPNQALPRKLVDTVYAALKGQQDK
jgi:hypothetical protein